MQGGSNDTTVLTSVQLDPGTAELLQNVVGNLTNITMLTNMVAVRALGRMRAGFFRFQA